MKLAAIFLLIGAAMALPQNFYFSYPSKDDSSQNDHPVGFRGNLNVHRANYHPVHPAGWPLYDDDPVMDEDSQSRSQQRLFGAVLGGGSYNPLFNPPLRPVVTVYQYTSTISTPSTQTLTTYCIPKDSFDAAPNPPNPCAVVRKRRGIWTESELEEPPSKVEQVVATTAEQLPSTGRSRSDLTIDSSKDDNVQPENSGGNRQKRQFFGLLQRTLTTVLKTNFTSTSVTTSYRTATINNILNPNAALLGCLPPGYVVC